MLRSDDDRRNRGGCLIIAAMLLLALGLIVGLAVSSGPKPEIDQIVPTPGG